MLKRGQRNSGFTIVELLIVIVIIGILAAITTVAYSGIQLKAETSARLSEMKAWEKIFLSYQAQNGSWPSTMAPGSTTCLGYGFPVGANGDRRCKNIWSTTDGFTETSSAPTMTQLATLFPIPSSTKKNLNGAATPIAYRSSSSGYINIVQVFSPATAACPSGTTEEFFDPGIARWCRIRLEGS